MPPLDLLSFRRTHGPLLERLYGQSGATRWSLHDETFAEALYRSALHRFPDGARPADVASYLQALR